MSSMFAFSSVITFGIPKCSLRDLLSLLSLVTHTFCPVRCYSFMRDLLYCDRKITSACQIL